MKPRLHETDMADPLIELLQGDDHGRYRLDSPAEIAHYLRQLRDRGSFVSLYLDGRVIGPPSVLLAVERDGLVIDCDPATTDALSGKSEIAVSTSLDRVRIQFHASRPRRASFRGRPALGVDVPESMLRLQRRDFYRLTTPTQPALHCRLAIDPERRLWLETQILDISVGGVAIMVPPANHPFLVDTLFPSCRVAVPGGTIDAALRIRNLFVVTLPGAGSVLRAGCQFDDLSGTMGNLLQRYILNLERSRRAHGS